MLPRKSVLVVSLFLLVVLSMVLTACGAGQSLAELRDWYKGFRGLEIQWSGVYASMEVDYSTQLQTITDEHPLANECFSKTGEALDIAMRDLVEGVYDAGQKAENANAGGFDIKALGLNSLNPADMKLCQQMLVDMATDVRRLRSTFADNQKNSITWKVQIDKALQADVVSKVLLDLIRNSPTDQKLDEFKVPSMALHVQVKSQALCTKFQKQLEANGSLYGVPYNYGNHDFNPVQWDDTLNVCDLYGIAAYKYMSRVVISSAAADVFSSGEEQGIPGLSTTETPNK